jgi:hypothetical protein
MKLAVIPFQQNCSLPSCEEISRGAVVAPAAISSASSPP